MPRKLTERWQLERFVESYGGFPATEVRESEAPDFVLVNSSDTIGVEVTQLYRPSQPGRFTQRAVETFRERIVQQAHQIYVQRGGSAADVSIAFSDTFQGCLDPEPVAAALAETINRFYPSAQPWILVTDEDWTAQLPAQLTWLTISRYHTSGEGFWYMMQDGRRAILDSATLQTALDAKNPRVAAYGNAAEQIWLLVVMDALYFSSSFSVPDAVLRERYISAFDRAFLFSALERRWWELLQRQS